MSQYILPHFEPLDLESLDSYYDAQIQYNGNEVDLDLNFWGEPITPARLDLVKNILENLKGFDSKNRQYIDQDFADESADTVKTYLDFHLTELDEEDLARFVDYNNPITPEQQLINALKLVRVGFYPDEGEDQIAVFDYSLGNDITDHLVVIFINEKGEMDHITMES
jgi:hypothetical protein